jgi:hypothetical protein
MKRLITAAATAAGSLALLGGALVATGAPASASTDIAAFGATAFGLIHLSPVALATVGDSPAVASNANLTRLLTTGVIQDRAIEDGATSQVNPVNLTLPAQGSMTATGLRSWCLDVGDGSIGSANIYSGAVMQVGAATIHLPVNPRRNQTVVLPAGGGTLVLNAQFTVGGHDVYAAVAAHLGPERVLLGVSVCQGEEL